MTYSHENITATATQSVPSSNGWEVKNWETGTWDTPLPAGVSLLGWIEEAIGWPTLVAPRADVVVGATAPARATPSEEKGG